MEALTVKDRWSAQWRLRHSVKGCKGWMRIWWPSKQDFYIPGARSTWIEPRCWDMLRPISRKQKGLRPAACGFSLCSNSADLETCDLWSCDDCSPWHSAGPRRKAVRGTVGQHQMQPCLLWIWYAMVTLGRCIGLLTEGTNAWWGQMLRWLSEQKFIEISCLGGHPKKDEQLLVSWCELWIVDNDHGKSPPVFQVYTTKTMKKTQKHIERCRF